MQWSRRGGPSVRSCHRGARLICNVRRRGVSTEGAPSAMGWASRRRPRADATLVSGGGQRSLGASRKGALPWLTCKSGWFTTSQATPVCSLRRRAFEFGDNENKHLWYIDALVVSPWERTFYPAEATYDLKPNRLLKKL